LKASRFTGFLNSNVDAESLALCRMLKASRFAEC
jgi:hypothetical protein